MGIGSSKGAFYEDDFGQAIGKNLNSADNNEWSPNEIMPHTAEPVDPSHYETVLTDEQEGKFQDWKSKMAPNDSGHDYDLRGAFLNNVTPDKETGHWPDTFKKPNHPTFSDQSMYAGERPDLAGRWQGDVYIPPLPITPIANKIYDPTQDNVMLKSLKLFEMGTPAELYKSYREGGATPDEARELILESLIHKGGSEEGKSKEDAEDTMRRQDMLELTTKNKLAANVTTSTGVTITDEDIDKAMNLGMSFSGGGLTTGKVVPMRRAANDNKPVYNPREPDMIGSKVIDDEIISMQEAFINKQQKISDSYGERAKLHDIRKERDWSDIDLAKFNKIGKEINEISGDINAAPRLETPLKKFEPPKDNKELNNTLEQLKELFSKLEK